MNAKLNIVTLINAKLFTQILATRISSIILKIFTKQQKQQQAALAHKFPIFFIYISPSSIELKFFVYWFLTIGAKRKKDEINNNKKKLSLATTCVWMKKRMNEKKNININYGNNKSKLKKKETAIKSFSHTTIQKRKKLTINKKKSKYKQTKYWMRSQMGKLRNKSLKWKSIFL